MRRWLLVQVGGLGRKDSWGGGGIRGLEELEVEDAGGVSGGVEQVDHKVDAVVGGDLTDVVAGLRVGEVGELEKGVAIDGDSGVGRDRSGWG